jgi:hypothetical protein
MATGQKGKLHKRQSVASRDLSARVIKEIKAEKTNFLTNNIENSIKPKGKGRKYNALVANASCPAPFQKRK